MNSNYCIQWWRHVKLLMSENAVMDVEYEQEGVTTLNSFNRWDGPFELSGVCFRRSLVLKHVHEDYFCNFLHIFIITFTHTPLHCSDIWYCANVFLPDDRWWPLSVPESSVIDSLEAELGQVAEADQRLAEPGFVELGRWRWSPGLPEKTGDMQDQGVVDPAGALPWWHLDLTEHTWSWTRKKPYQ